MTFARLLSIIGVIICAVIALGGLVNFWIGYAEKRDTQRAGVEALSQGIAATIRWQIQDLQRAIESMASQPELVALLEENDPVKLEAASAGLSNVIHGGLRVRLLKNTIIEPDQTAEPHMGYADLQMVHAAAENNPQAMVHEFKSKNRHLAIARRVMAGERVVGVILASISPQVVIRPFSAFSLPGVIELKQGPLRLALSGEDPGDSEPEGTIPIRGTAWTINYWLAHDVVSFLALIAVATAGTAILAVLTLVLANRWLRSAFNNDQNRIVTVARGLLIGKVQGNYPVKIKDFENLVGLLVKLKRESGVSIAVQDSGLSVVDELEAEELAVPTSNLLGNNHDTQEKEPQIADSIFRAYDIRGIVDESLSEDNVTLIGRALGSEAREADQNTVVIAQDGRLSSPRLANALAKGLQSAGCNVVDIGVVPTPLLYFATHYLDTQSGIMVTGSHNPSNYNGLKMVINGETLSGQRIQKLRQRVETEDFAEGAGALETRDLIPDYVGSIIDDVQIGSPLKIVVDCGNGVAGKLAPVLLRTLGCEVVELYCEVDGNFPNHHPDPAKPENLKDLIAKVAEENANLGVAFDGDGDRLGVIDSSGKIIWPDRQMMLFAADVLSRQPGSDVIFDVKCSRNLSKEIVRLGGRPMMWKTGHSLIKAKIKETSAPLAGELSGHIFFNDRWYGFDDGLYAAARLVEILSADPRSSSEVFEELPDSVNTPELNIRMEEGENFKFVKELMVSNQFGDAKITDIDGLRADYPEGWGLVRPSNTSPSLVLRFEADNQQALETIQQRFKVAMTAVKADLSLPF